MKVRTGGAAVFADTLGAGFFTSSSLEESDESEEDSALRFVGCEGKGTRASGARKRKR